MISSTELAALVKDTANVYQKTGEKIGFFGHLKAEMFYGIVSLQPFTQILITMDMDLPLSISCLVPEIKSAHYKLSGDGWEFTQN